MLKNCYVIIASVVVLAFLSCAWADEVAANQYWPQWRGPGAMGIAPNANPPLKWSEQKHIRWKIAIPGCGHASPIVWDKQIFVLTAIATDQVVAVKEKKPLASWQRRMGISTPDRIYKFVIIAIDRSNGKILWQRTACQEAPHEGIHRDGSWASNSPVTDGEHVYAYFGSRGLYCFDMSGKLIWQKKLGNMSIKRSFGEGISPALYGNAIVVNWDHEGQCFIIALDKKTGKQLWKIDRDEVTSWATPLIIEYQGKRQVIVSASKRVRSYDLANGTLIWQCGGMTYNVVPSPVIGNGMVYVTSGFRGNALLAIRLDQAKGDITASKAIAWSYKKHTPYVPSPLLYGDCLYILKHNSGIISCLDAKTGRVNYSCQRLPKISGVYASPVAAQGRIYLLGRNGVTVVIANGPRFKVLATNTLADKFSASPAIVARKIFVRGYRHLYCIGE